MPFCQGLECIGVRCRSYIRGEGVMRTRSILYAVVLAYNILESTLDEF